MQGIGSVGVTPTLKQAILDALRSSASACTLPTIAGARHDGLHARPPTRRDATRRSAWAATSSAATRRDVRRAGARQARLDHLPDHDAEHRPRLGHGAARRSILPVLPRDEEPQPTTQESMFNYVRLSDGGAGALRRGRAARCRSSPSSAARVLGDDGAGRLERAREPRSGSAQLIAELIPGYEPLADIDRTQQRVPHRRPASRHAARFPTASRQGAVSRGRRCPPLPATRGRSCG